MKQECKLIHSNVRFTTYIPEQCPNLVAYGSLVHIPSITFFLSVNPLEFRAVTTVSRPYALLSSVI
jgi:hypothetical protein